MKKTQILFTLTDKRIRDKVKTLQRKEVYLLHIATFYPHRYDRNGYVIQVTHFHKTALRCKVLACRFPLTFTNRTLKPRYQKRHDRKYVLEAHIISIPYSDIADITFEKIPLVKMPLYINQATVGYARYLSEVTYQKEDTHASKEAPPKDRAGHSSL